MIKVGIIGAAGRMGKRFITNIVESDDLQLSGALEIANSPFLGMDAAVIAGCGESGIKITDQIDEVINNSDAIIDFSLGDVVENARKAVAQNCNVVIGTTALGEEGKKALAEVAKDGKIVFASNMSVGVNLLFKLCNEVTKILGEDYDIEIVEMHHNMKKDSPSGTAVSLAEAIVDARDEKYEDVVVHGREGIVGERTKKEIGMHAVRGGDVVGDHTVIFATGGERIELTHKASSRDTFAKGALRAVRFLATETENGLYDMQDVLGLK
ncbi:4-hydroxy-tetrahydrodipicolinate reductase [Lentisphaerota bacterium WC36G]|nr:4-hydroxy-tetrahydrodipicolinate reductase [Lentisphaerae bacterium WC36]